MPISIKFGLLFVHIPKTGGSSIEQALEVRGLENAGTNEPVPDIAFGKLDGVHLQHLTVRELDARGYLDGPAKGYFRFSMVRNPWDRMVSEFEYQRRRGVLEEQGLADFDEFVNAIRDGHFDDNVHFRPQVDFLVDDSGEIAVDQVGRFEKLASDFRSVCSAAGVAAPALPALKQTRHGHFASYYDDRTRTIVADRFAADIDRFEYRFDERYLGVRLRRPLNRVRSRFRH